MRTISKSWTLGCLAIGLGIAALGMSSPRSVTSVDGSQVYGGTDTFVCKNLCTQNEGGCFPLDPVLECTQVTIGQVCGEFITKVYEVKGCVKQDAGNMTDCTNDLPEKKCYRAKNCRCVVGGMFINCEAPLNIKPTLRGSANGSSNC